MEDKLALCSDSYASSVCFGVYKYEYAGADSKYILGKQPRNLNKLMEKGKEEQ